jgi:hypothetical protein
MRLSFIKPDSCSTTIAVSAKTQQKMHTPFMGNKFPSIKSDIKAPVLKNHYYAKIKLCNVLMSIFYLV